MKINEYGAVFLTPEELLDSIYANKLPNFKNIYLDPATVDQFNSAKDLNKDQFDSLRSWQQPTATVEQFDKENRSNWFMPHNYCPDLIDTVYGSCTTEQQRARVDQELSLFIQHDLLDLLFYLKYLVDTMRNNNIVWGVGRGSSVSSYILFLIGIHKIDSLKYDLDIKEFLK